MMPYHGNDNALPTVGRYNFGILKIAYPNSGGANNGFQGALDGIAIYDVALTPAQVKARFESTRQRPSKPLPNGLSEAQSL
jgi:hypothetical protein